MDENTENTENSAGSEESAAPATDGRAVMSDRRTPPQEQPEALDRALENQPKKPRFEPSPGTRHVYDPKRGMWIVERDDREDTLATDKPAISDEKKEDGQEQEQAPPGVELPEILPDYIRDSPEIQTLVAEGAAAMKLGGEYGDVEVQRVVDLVSQFELEIGTEQPPLHEEERIRAMLKVRWGDFYEGRLEKTVAFVKARPALKAYLNKSGGGNQLSVIEALAMVACGEMARKPEEAAEILKMMRTDPKSPLRNPYSKGHKLALQQAKVFADIVDRREKFLEKKTGRQGSVEEMVKDRTAKPPAGDSPQAKLEAELKQLRLDPAYYDKSKPNNKAVVERVRAIYAELYPD